MKAVGKWRKSECKEGAEKKESVQAERGDASPVVRVVCLFRSVA